MSGRDTKLTPEVHARLCDDLANAVPRRFACERAGVGVRTFRRWLAWGRDGEEPFAALLAGVKKAEADAVAKHLSNIEAHAADSWQASAWTLERRWNEEFGSQKAELKALRKQIQELIALVHVGHLASPAAAAGPARPAARRPRR